MTFSSNCLANTSRKLGNYLLIILSPYGVKEGFTAGRVYEILHVYPGGGGHSENILVGCALAHKKGGFRCGHSLKKGGITCPKKGEGFFRIGLVKKEGLRN